MEEVSWCLLLGDGMVRVVKVFRSAEFCVVWDWLGYLVRCVVRVLVVVCLHIGCLYKFPQHHE
jgi:hypothetical protein